MNCFNHFVFIILFNTDTIPERWYSYPYFTGEETES